VDDAGGSCLGSPCARCEGGSTAAAAAASRAAPRAPPLGPLLLALDPALVLEGRGPATAELVLGGSGGVGGSASSGGARPAYFDGVPLSALASRALAAALARLLPAAPASHPHGDGSTHRAVASPAALRALAALLRHAAAARPAPPRLLGAPAEGGVPLLDALLAALVAPGAHGVSAAAMDAMDALGT
jgi:hypothetical protein